MQTYVVSGAASGIGAATSALLREQGHRVVTVDLRDADVTADLSTPAGGAAAVAGVRDLVDVVHGVVPAAGIGGFTGTDPALVGVLYAVNTVGIALFQIPVTRVLARRGDRRTRVVAVGGAVFALSFLSFAALGVVASGLPLLLGVFAATALFTAGELLHGTTASALVAGAAPEATRGRYMATYQLSWSLPTAVAPALLTALLALSPVAMWLVLAGGVCVSAVAILRLEARLPADAVHLHREPAAPVAIGVSPATDDRERAA